MPNDVWTSTTWWASPRHVTTQDGQAKLDMPVDIPIATEWPPLALERPSLHVEERARLCKTDGPVCIQWVRHVCRLDASDASFKIRVQTFNRSAVLDRDWPRQVPRERRVCHDVRQRWDGATMWLGRAFTWALCHGASSAGPEWMGEFL